MAKYVIKNIQCGLTSSGLDADTVNVEVEFQDESGKSVFISEIEFQGFPNIFKTDESVYNKLVNRGVESEEAADELSVEELNDIETALIEDLNENHCLYSGENYEEFYEDEECGDDLHEAMRFVIYVLRADWDEIDRAKKEYIGKAIGEFETPKCDAQRAWEQGVELGEEEEE